MTDSPTLHHTTIGAGDRPIVFLHGLFGQGKNFTSVAKALAARHAEVRCVLVDLPNHGRSGWVAEVSYPDMADQVADLITTISPDRPVVLVGHSMGGKVAMQLALRHPDMVEALVVVDISPVASAQVSSQFAHLVEAMRGLDLTAIESRSAADAQLRAPIADDMVRGFLLQNLRHDHRAPAGEQWRWQMNLEVLGDQLDRVGEWTTRPDDVYDGPVVWISGADSSYVTDEHADPMRTLFPRARLVRVKHSGHWVHAEQPEAFVEIVSRVIAG